MIMHLSLSSSKLVAHGFLVSVTDLKTFPEKKTVTLLLRVHIVCTSAGDNVK